MAFSIGNTAEEARNMERGLVVEISIFDKKKRGISYYVQLDYCLRFFHPRIDRRPERIREEGGGGHNNERLRLPS
jgi:hypothetical protein